MTDYLERIRQKKTFSHTHGEAVTKVSKAPDSGCADPFGTFGTPFPKGCEKNQDSRHEDMSAAEHRRQRVLAMLDQHPDTRYAVHVDDPDSDPVIVALAIRDSGTCELAIPRENYDGFEVMRLIDENTQPESRSPT